MWDKLPAVEAESDILLGRMCAVNSSLCDVICNGWLMGKEC